MPPSNKDVELGLECRIWHLKQFNLFDTFSREELESVSQILHLKEYQKRAPIVLPVDPERRIYFLMRGKAKLSKIEQDGKEVIVDILRSGEVFGHLAFPQQQYYDAVVVALERCTVGHIHESDFHDLLARHPQLCFEINKLMGTRLVRVENRLTELLFRDVPCRLARLLLRLSDEYPEQLSCGTRITMTLTQQELANLIGASRERVNLTLNRFKDRGWIAIHRHHICVHNKRALLELAR